MTFASGLPSRSLIMALTLSAFPANASETVFPCDGVQASVITDSSELAGSVCNAVSLGLDTLAGCNIALLTPISIELEDTLPKGCMGQYHCGDGRIQLLTPEAMQTARSQDNSLAFVETSTYFQSVLTHELAHAAYAAVPCPFEDCLVTSEYIANTMQVMSLPPADIERFEAANDMETPVARDSLNKMIYYMAPDVFRRRAWVHLNQRPDACGYIASIMRGDLLLDREHFEQ